MWSTCETRVASEVDVKGIGFCQKAAKAGLREVSNDRHCQGKECDIDKKCDTLCCED